MSLDQFDLLYGSILVLVQKEQTIRLASRTLKVGLFEGGSVDSRMSRVVIDQKQANTGRFGFESRLIDFTIKVR